MSSAGFDDAIAEFGGGLGQEMPEAAGEAPEHGDLIGGIFVDLPDLEADMGRERQSRIAGPEGAGMKIDGQALGESIAGMRPGNPDDGAAVALFAHRRRSGEENGELSF